MAILRLASHYEVLGISFNTPTERVREAYLRAKSTFEVNSLATYSLLSKSESEGILKKIEEAYKTLSDAELRKKYDQEHGFLRPEDFAGLTNLKMNIGPQHGEVKEAPISHSMGIFPETFLKEELEIKKKNLAKVLPMKKKEEPNRLSKQMVTPLLQSEETQKPENISLFGLSIHKKYEKNPELEKKLQEATNVDGAFLKAAREYKNVSVQEMMEYTKLTRRYILAIEEMNTKQLPATAYVRGFVTQYAKALRLQSEKIASAYIRSFKKLAKNR